MKQKMNWYMYILIDSWHVCGQIRKKKNGTTEEIVMKFRFPEMAL